MPWPRSSIRPRRPSWGSTGRAAWTVDYLRRFGVETAAGEIVISGSVVPLLDIAAGQHLRHELYGIEAIAVSII